MEDDIFGSYGFSERFPIGDRIGSNRSPPRPHHGLVVYVVISVNRGLIRQASIQDRQTDIEVLGVFTSQLAAQNFCDDRDPLHHRHLVVHQTIMRTNQFDRSTFRTQIYS